MQGSKSWTMLLYKSALTHALCLLLAPHNLEHSNETQKAIMGSHGPDSPEHVEPCLPHQSPVSHKSSSRSC